MNVLVGCECSQVVTAAFRRKGHNAFSCDIKECYGNMPEYHIHGDLIDILDMNLIKLQSGDYTFIDKWDLLIAHPPCTYLSNAGACRLYPVKGVMDLDRYYKGMLGREFFIKLLNCEIEKICIENPLPSKVFKLPKETQIIEPYMFGEYYSKKTLLWLKNLKPLKPTNIIENYVPYVNSGKYRYTKDCRYKGVSRSGGAAQVRSQTFAGIAKAMAAQWG